MQDFTSNLQKKKILQYSNYKLQVILKVMQDFTSNVQKGKNFTPSDKHFEDQKNHDVQRLCKAK